MSDSQTESKPGLGDLDVFVAGTPPVKVTEPKTEQARIRAEAQPKPKTVSVTAKNRAIPAVKPALARREKVVTRSQVFYLADEQIAGLKRLSQQSDRSKSDLVREAIGEYLAKYKA